MGIFATLMMIVGLILFASALMQMLKMRSFSFKNKRVIAKQKITFMLGGAGLLLLLYLFIVSLF